MLATYEDIVMHSDMVITTEYLVLILPNAVIVLGVHNTIDHI